MNQAILDFLLQIVTAIGKQAAIEATPVGLGIAQALGETLVATTQAVFSRTLNHADRTALYDAAWENVTEIVQVAEREGTALASEVTSLIAAAAASEVKAALGIGI